MSHLRRWRFVLSLIAITLIASATSHVQQIPVPENADYTRFSHASAYHARLPCALCHKRESNSTRPTLPGRNEHAPCAGCHVKQFAANSGPICTICHTAAQTANLKSFPRLRSFNMKFDHARHVAMRNVGCASCHRPLRSGVALSIPAGFNAHATCFRCHTPNATSGEKNISSCDVCHQPGRLVRTRQTAAAFRVGFSHAKHDRSEGLSCNECHRVRAGAAQVSAPQPLNHHATSGAFSCMSCHNGKKVFGGDDFSVCKRCHTGEAWHF